MNLAGNASNMTSCGTMHGWSEAGTLKSCSWSLCCCCHGLSLNGISGPGNPDRKAFIGIGTPAEANFHHQGRRISWVKQPECLHHSSKQEANGVAHLPRERASRTQRHSRSRRCEPPPARMRMKAFSNECGGVTGCTRRNDCGDGAHHVWGVKQVGCNDRQKPLGEIFR